MGETKKPKRISMFQCLLRKHIPYFLSFKLVDPVYSMTQHVHISQVNHSSSGMGHLAYLSC